jgi:hypothetical protein
MVVDHVDCDEYPCLAWVRDPCEALGDLFSFDLAIFRDLTLGDGTSERWRVLTRTSERFPPAEADILKMTVHMTTARMETRSRKAEAAILATTGARVMTDRELAVERLAKAERMLDETADDDAMREMVEKQVAEARAQLARLEGQP